MTTCCDNCKDLYTAADKAHPLCLEKLLKNPSDELTCPDKFKELSPLHLAARGYLEKSTECTKILIDNGYNVNNKCNKYLSTPIMQNVYLGKHESFKLLLENDADLTLLNSRNESCLSLSVFFDNHEALLLIVEKLKLLNLLDQFINLPDVDGNTALIYSIRAQDGGKCGRILLENGADPNFVNNDGYTAYDYAFCKEIEFCKYMEDYCKEKNIKLNKLKDR